MLRNFLLAIPSVLLLDLVWLGFVARDFNLRQLAEIGRIENGSFQMHYTPAALAYLLMALSLALFSIPRAAAAGSGGEAFLWGSALGLVIYGVFDMTNLAILRGYPLAFAVADVAWGTFLYGVVTWGLGWLWRG